MNSLMTADALYIEPPNNLQLFVLLYVQSCSVYKVNLKGLLRKKNGINNDSPLKEVHQNQTQLLITK